MYWKLPELTKYASTGPPPFLTDPNKGKNLDNPVASTIAAAAKSIQQINSQPGGSGGGSTGGGGGSSAQLSAPRVAGMSAPQINTGGGMNPSSQIAETLGAAQKPVRAYVISGDVSSAQALDRRTSRAATFTGGWWFLLLKLLI